MDLKLSRRSLLCVRHANIVIDEVHAHVVKAKFFFRFFLRRFWIEEEVCVGVAVVFDLRIVRVAVAEREIAVCARGEALDTALAIVSDLLIEWVLPHDSGGSHCANWPE